MIDAGFVTASDSFTLSLNSLLNTLMWYFSLQGFGRANHAVTTEKLKAQYPDYEVTWDNEGY